MSVAASVRRDLENASWIRRMFEAAAELRRTVNPNDICDLSLGNPLLEPPTAVLTAIQRAATSTEVGRHRYMPNAGYQQTRRVVAERVSREQEVTVDAQDVTMTVGAAGAINVALHALLDPGDEVIVFAPYFVEYLFYIKNHGGLARIVETTPRFEIDCDAVEKALTANTKLILLNTPNNPTGKILDTERWFALTRCLARYEKQHGKPIYVLIDTPYAQLTLLDKRNPRFFPEHRTSLIAHSHSKDLGLAGERIGYLVTNPRDPNRDVLQQACVFCNRVLGFVNAPAIMQHVLAELESFDVNTDVYRRLGKRLCDGLRQAGFDFESPEGSFFVFPRVGMDDYAFCQALLREHVLAVPGRGFGRPGHIRLAFCVEQDVIDRAIPRLARVLQHSSQGSAPS